MKKTIVLCVAILLQLRLPLHAQQPFTLADCRRIAIEHSESMRKADNAVRQAELDRQIAFANYLPKLDGSLMGLYTKDQDIMNMTLQMRGTYLAGLNLTQPLYAGGQLTAVNRLAAIGKEVSLEQQRLARQQLIADVDRAYYQLIATTAKVQMLEAYAQQMQGLYDQVQLSVRVQMATDHDLLRISTRQQEIDYQLQKARNGETLCRLALCNVIGADLDTPISPADTVMSVAALPEPDEDISARPELHLLQQQIAATEQQAKIARAAYLPTVALTLGYTYYDNIRLKGTMQASDGNYHPFKDTFNGSSPMALLSVSVPLFHWGADLKKAKKARIDVDNARLDMQQTERGMRIEVRQAVQNLTDGYRMIQTATTGQQQADENLRQMRQRYDAQMATMTDLLDAQSQWQQARSNLIEAQTQQKLFETEYLRVTGRLE